MAISKLNITILSAVFVFAILISTSSVMSTQAAKDYPHDHKSTSESKALDACNGENSCEDCIKHRADLQGLKNYEVDNCLKDQY
jgi:hypothetical protein